MRTESRYVQKIGSGIYHDATAPSKKSGKSRARIDRITEESESKDKQTISKNREDHSVQEKDQESNPLIYPRRRKNFKKNNSVSQGMSFKKEPSHVRGGFSLQTNNYEPKETEDSIKKYLEFYDCDSNFDGQTSKTHDSFYGKPNSKPNKIEAQTIEFLQNYEGTEEISTPHSPALTGDQVSSNRGNATTNTGNTGKTQDLSSSKSLKAIQKSRQNRSFPKYRTLDNQIHDLERGNTSIGELKEESQVQSENTVEKGHENSFGIRPKTNPKYIEIRNMVFQNSGGSYSDETKQTFEMEKGIKYKKK